MLPITPDELRRWRAEVELAMEHREQEFGTYELQRPGSVPKTSGAGLNLEAFEQGAREDAEGLNPAPLNLVFPIIRTIIPTMFYQNPRVNALPDSRQSAAEDDAFYVSELLNRDLRNPDFRFKDTGQLSVFDGILLGVGVLKIGYATEFGPDILPTKAETKTTFRERIKTQVNTMLEAMGVKEPKVEEPEPEKVQADLTIRSESPYVRWISPFDFLIDPRAHDLTDAQWVGQIIRRTVAEIKRDRRYGPAKRDLVGDPLEHPQVEESFIEEFQTVEVVEVHYKDPDSPTGITTLTFAKTQATTKALMHDHNVYDLGGWQFEWLTPNKHGHRLWPISAVSVCRPLLDRINSSFDALLEQLDKFVAKVVVNTERIDMAGLNALQSPAIGAVVKVSGSGSVRDTVAMISMEQFNAEVTRFLDYCVDFIILIVGLTRAQLTGLTTAQTATEAQIGQGGSNIRRTDESNTVGDFFNRVVTKLWRCKAQFQSFTEIDLVQQAGIPNPQTGMETIAWYPPIDQEREDRLKRTRYQFHLELGSIQKPNVEIVRAQLEQFFRALMEPVVTQGLALENKRISVEEAIRQWSRYFAEYGLTRLDKVIVPITEPGLQDALRGYTGRPPTGTNGNGKLTGQVPNMADLISGASGEKGQGVSPV